MLFTSTRDNSVSVSFLQAVKSGMPADGGVYVPSPNSIEDLRRWIYYIDENTSFTSIAGTLTSAFLQDEFSPIICETIATSAFPFEPVVKQLDDNLFNMELYHGYTGSHRDFGVSYLCSYLETTSELNGGDTVFLDYTNGELGALLSNVLKNKKHIKAVLVYKKGTVRGLKEEDFVWNGGNIYPIEMEGSEAEIKAAVRAIFEDKELVHKKTITLANTTNVCRLMAQVFYYPYAFAQIKRKVDGDIFYALEPGNYSTLISGLYSWRFALPLNGFYVPSTPALFSDASGSPVVMDSIVSFDKRNDANPVDPANIERLESFFGNNKLMIRNFVTPCDVSEKQREKAAKELFIKYGVYADPGVASAYATVLERGMDVYGDDGTFVLISQNHPALHGEYCRHVLGEMPPVPENIQETFKPIELKGKVITSAEQLKQIIENI